MKIIPKFQGGGGFDSLFTVYNPATQRSRQQQASHIEKSTKSESSEDKGKLTEKDLFTMLKDIKGLPNEMKSIVSNLIDTLSISKMTGVGLEDLSTTYLQSLYKITQATDNKAMYDEAYKKAIETGSMSEPAITANGELVVQDNSGKVQKVTLENFVQNKDKYRNILTVSNLLNLRAYDPSFAYDYTVFDTVNSSMGYSAFQKLIKEAVGTLGSSQVTRGIMSSESELASKGLDVLAQLKESDQIQPGTQVSSDSLYRYKIIDQNQKKQIDYLTSYISALLPENAKIWAAIKLRTSDKEKATSSLITTYLSSGETTVSEVTMQPTKGSKDQSSSTTDSIVQNTPTKWLRGLGVQEIFTINPGTNYATQVLSNTLPLTDSEKKYLGANSVLQQATSGEYAGVLDFSSASMGMRRIDSSNFGKIVLTDGKISSIDFPSKVLENGTIVPDLSPETYQAKQAADKEIKQLGIDLQDIKSISANYKTINDIYVKHKLNPAYNPDGTPTDNWARFGVINASASNRALGMDQFDTNELLQPINDDAIVDSLLQITKEENFDKNEWYDFNGVDHFYRGTVWIPIKVSYIAAQANVGMKTDELQDIIVREQQLNASKVLTTEKK